MNAMLISHWQPVVRAAWRISDHVCADLWNHDPRLLANLRHLQRDLRLPRDRDTYSDAVEEAVDVERRKV